MTNLGSLNLLGISVKRDSSRMFLSQHKYDIEILKRASMAICNSSRTPVETESKLSDDGDLVSNLTLYQSLAGSLQYLTFTCFDISYAVQHLFSSSTTDLVAYLDADWAGCPTTRRSTSEAEYRGVANAVVKACWLRNLLRELHTSFSSVTLVYCDNVSDVYLSSNMVRVLHVPSHYQYANIFTKALDKCLSISYFFFASDDNSRRRARFAEVDFGSAVVAQVLIHEEQHLASEPVRPGKNKRKKGRKLDSGNQVGQRFRESFQEERAAIRGIVPKEKEEERRFRKLFPKEGRPIDSGINQEKTDKENSKEKERERTRDQSRSRLIWG
ncbi:ribonuclease H-like domain-containing protein [Tanacetum coccineum]